jgi:hypothetical protein
MKHTWMAGVVIAGGLGSVFIYPASSVVLGDKKRSRGSQEQSAMEHGTPFNGLTIANCVAGEPSLGSARQS